MNLDGILSYIKGMDEREQMDNLNIILCRLHGLGVIEDYEKIEEILEESFYG